MPVSFVYLSNPPRRGRREERRGPVHERLEDWVPRVYRFALRLTADVNLAEDLTQETFLRAWRQRGSLREPQATRVWLFRITANLWRDRLRRGRSPIAQAGPLDGQQLCPMQLPEHAAANHEELAKALAAMDGLPPRQREVLYLCACEGMTPTEAAEVLQTSADAAKANLSLARKRIRELLGE
jgi:RNA polymerase sigma-70 factor (ECF subfamily)